MRPSGNSKLVPPVYDLVLPHTGYCMAKMHLPQDVHLRYSSLSRDGRGVGEQYGIRVECTRNHILTSFRKILFCPFGAPAVRALG